MLTVGYKSEHLKRPFTRLVQTNKKSYEDRIAPIAWCFAPKVVYTILFLAFWVFTVDSVAQEQSSVLMFRARGALVKNAAAELENRLSSGYTVSVVPNPVDAGQIKDEIAAKAPRIVVILDQNYSQLSSYRTFQSSAPYASTIPVIYVNELTGSTVNLSGCISISYHPPALQGVSTFITKYGKTVKNIGILYRSHSKDFISQNITACESKGLIVSQQMLPVKAPNFDDLLSKALKELDRSDIIWVPMDRELLNPRLAREVWKPALGTNWAKNVIVADCSVDFEASCVDATPADIALETAQRVDEIKRNGWALAWTGSTPLTSYIEQFGMRASLTKPTTRIIANVPLDKGISAATSTLPSPAVVTDKPNNPESETVLSSQGAPPVMQADSEATLAIVRTSNDNAQEELKVEEKSPENREDISIETLVENIRRSVETNPLLSRLGRNTKPSGSEYASQPSQNADVNQNSRKKQIDRPANVNRSTQTKNRSQNPRSVSDTFMSSRLNEKTSVENASVPIGEWELFRTVLSSFPFWMIGVIAGLLLMVIVLVVVKRMRRVDDVEFKINDVVLQALPEAPPEVVQSNNLQSNLPECVILARFIESGTKESVLEPNAALISNLATELGISSFVTSNQAMVVQLFNEITTSIVCIDNSYVPSMKWDINAFVQTGDSKRQLRVLVFNCPQPHMTSHLSARALLYRFGSRINSWQLKTILHMPDTESLSGSIQNDNVINVFQVMEIGKKTGIMLVDSNGHFGTVCFENGRIISAVAKNFSGEQAVYLILGLQSGFFKVIDNKLPSNKNMDTGVFELLLNHAKIIDETST